MGEFFLQHGIEFILGLLSTGLLAFCGFLAKQMRKYKLLLDKQEKEEINHAIELKLEPIYQDLEDLREFVRRTSDIEAEHLRLILASYRFRLIQICKAFMHQGFMTQDQYDQLTEFYKVYVGLGGNGQAKEYYDRALLLPIKEEEQ